MQQGGIKVPINKSYSYPQKLYCLPCIDNCRNSNILTKNKRNQRKQIMNDLDCPSLIQDDSECQYNQFMKKSTVQILKALYYHSDQNVRNRIFQSLKSKRLNPMLSPKNNLYRDDIQYFIPQLITYLAFQEDLEDQELKIFLCKACELDYIFSHYCYFYLRSLSKINQFQINQIQSYIQNVFLPDMTEIYGQHKLYGFELARNNINVSQSLPSKLQNQTIAKYGTIQQDQIRIDSVTSIKLTNYHDNSYLSTPKFWDDLIQIGNRLKNYNPKIIGLKSQIKNINRKLPAVVYIPFYKDSIRFYTILNIDTTHCRVYSTKQRSPYSIYLEIFRQQEQFAEISFKQKQLKNSKYQKFMNYLNDKLSKPFTIFQGENTLNFRLKSTPLSQKQIQYKKTKPSSKNHILSGINFTTVKQRKSSFNEQEDKKQDVSYEEFAKTQQSYDSQKDLKISETTQDYGTIEDILYNNNVNKKVFGKKFSEIEAEIKAKSIYKNFKTWKLVNIMIKVGDNLKQQQFAMQLINQFNIIFNIENTGLLLTPYEVISLGPDSGIIEMITDATSLAKIMAVMKMQKINTLREFFKLNFKRDQYRKAKHNFCRSLAAYSVITYFLQIKDRHNQNILLHRNGNIIHIDFGYFLSNTPGKGIQLERNVPFKLMSAYVDVLGGYNSFSFLQFRILFQKGFRAALQHKDEILILVKMMYSSHGESMPCFQKGEQAIINLQQRFNPKANNISELCQNLINNSLDNWRARWYDKFQYWLQGIMY